MGAPQWLTDSIAAEGGYEIYKAMGIIENFELVTKAEYLAALRVIDQNGKLTRVMENRARAYLEPVEFNFSNRPARRKGNPKGVQRTWEVVETEWLMLKYTTLTVPQLAEKLKRSQQSVREKLSSLEKKGLLKRSEIKRKEAKR